MEIARIVTPGGSLLRRDRDVSRLLQVTDNVTLLIVQRL